MRSSATSRLPPGPGVTRLSSPIVTRTTSWPGRGGTARYVRVGYGAEASDVFATWQKPGPGSGEIEA